MKNRVSLNGRWKIDYLSPEPYTGAEEPAFDILGQDQRLSSVTPCPVPGYWEDQLDAFRATSLHTKLRWNPLYTQQRYPQVGYVPDMALPNPVGCFVYKRSVRLAYVGRSQLYIGGAQNAVSAWINGVYLGRHEGYSAEFFFDIPEAVLQCGENAIVLAVSNNRLSGYLGRPVSGLTSRAANECTGGIYGDVELRFYPDGLRDLWVTTAADVSSFTVHTDGGTEAVKQLEILDGKTVLASAEIPAGETSATLPAAGYDRWTPSSPKLYTVRVSTANQTLSRSFGIRRLTVRGTKLYLNGEPIFFRGTCEHCYQPLTVHPTRDKRYYRHILRTLKSLGFNGIRFHTWVPMQEYLQAADELGMLMEIETPNNTTYDEWEEIVKTCRHYTSAVMYSSGNEMVIDEPYIEHLRACAHLVHKDTDALFSPMSAMRGVEYFSYGDHRVEKPFPHNPTRLAALGEFCDVYNSYSLSQTSYDTDQGDPKLLDYRNAIYGKPLLTHEICIQGTYCDLSLKDRYVGSRIGDTEFLSSVEKHLADKGLLDKAPLYYKNSAAWQRLQRKHCFEVVRRAHTFAGYDFLGDIDTHWHTFGYCVGMMNEFYELKPGETVENVLRYNSDTVLLADLPRCLNYEAAATAQIPILVSNYGRPLEKAQLRLRVSCGKQVLLRRSIPVDAPAGEITELYTLKFRMPKCEKPEELILTAELSGGDTECENRWELYVFPKPGKLPGVRTLRSRNVTVLTEADGRQLLHLLEKGRNVVLLGAGPFTKLDAAFQLSVAGRTNGHLATVIDDHPLMEQFPHHGYCGWPFRQMLHQSCAAVLDLPGRAHRPIIDLASTYKNAHKEAVLFEYAVGKGKLLVCTLNLPDTDPGACWLKGRMLSYAMSEDFLPEEQLTAAELTGLWTARVVEGKNTNEAQNQNDITMTI